MEPSFNRKRARGRNTYEQQINTELGDEVSIALAKEDKRKSLKNSKQLKIEKSKSYRFLKFITKWMDKYFLDGIIGLIPVVGDLFTVIFSLPFFYVSITKIKSIPLTLAVAFNILFDLVIGLIPFIGEVGDFAFRSFRKNLRLTVGFVEDDRAVIKKVNKKAALLGIGVFLLIVIIYFLIKFVTLILYDTYDWITSF